MIRNRLYYALKPFVPASTRLAVRRWFAVRKRSRVQSEWPIKPGSEKAPPGWTGWPGGKRFALVLTHDVEGEAGLERCRKLMKLEMKMNVRSCFNFIPEGSYRIPFNLMEELRYNGFEIGIHDLHHDGKLYNSRQAFAIKAARINEHLKDWSAVGFRSGFMLRQLDWLHDLQIQYDSSTFDTDPFEPQPDGAGTIFPFQVSRLESPLPDGHQPGGISQWSRGYVELPYTLPQDSTLFLLLREESNAIWKGKLDWIAENGGMALCNVHPDYIQFEGDRETPFTYPAAFYETFLSYAISRYGASAWHALPCEVAQNRSQAVNSPPVGRCLPGTGPMADRQP